MTRFKKILRRVPYALLTLLTAIAVIVIWFLYHVWWGRLS